MFKKILAATLAMLAAVAMLFSCGGNDPTGNNGGGGGNDNKVIYSPSTELNIISAAGEIDAKFTSDLASAISKLSGKMPRVLTDASETGAHEIVIGNTKRSISQTAYSLIEEPDDFNTGRYVIYSTEESLAIAALLHDVCKTNFYKTEMRNVKKNGVWESVPYYTIEDNLPYGHGEKSVYIISGFMKLTRDEAFAIRYHMGFSGTEDANQVGKALEMFPLAFLLCMADMEASYYVEGSPQK